MAKVQKIATPKGKLEWVTISGEGKENLSGKQKYLASIVLHKDAQIVKDIEEYWNENKPKGFKAGRKSDTNKKGFKSNGVYPHDVPTGEVDEDGDKIYERDEKNIVLRFSTDTTFPDGKAKTIGIYNAKNRKVALPEGTMIGNGTIGCISGAMGIYENQSDAGVTLYLNDIQIIKLEEYSQDAGFGTYEDEEDGWTGEPDFEGEPEPEAEASEEKAKPRL